VTYLSKYFTLDEMIASQTAVRKHIDNTPSAEIIENLKEACTKADRVRDLLGSQMIVTSGFRSMKLNTAVGGSKTSSHMQGNAMDFRCPDFGTPKEVFDFLKKNLREKNIHFDQLILEFPNTPSTWVHIGFGSEMRGEILVYDGKSYSLG
jgi:zinc D-Ala-D-Ala carboxypeptidase